VVRPTWVWRQRSRGWPYAAGMAGQLFERYSPLIAALPDGPLSEGDLMTDAFRLEHEGDLAVYYVPFEQINPGARVVLIGITPGFTQMRIAYEVARDGLRDGLSHEEILERVDETASFAGSMRSNLNRMLDDLGLPGMLGIDHSEQLFAEHSGLIHSTSALRNPVFVAGRNYTGSSPRIAETPLLRQEVVTTLGPELAQVPDAIVIPLGRAAQSALELLVADGVVARERCCLGFPHPSGANGHRARLFTAERSHLTQTLTAWFDAPTPPPTISAREPEEDVWQRIGGAVAAASAPHERADIARRLRQLADDLERSR
jgi:hypothetical protein